MTNDQSKDISTESTESLKKRLWRTQGQEHINIFQEHSEVKKELWGGEFWEGGYFARTVGDKVTEEVIRKYIKYHREQEKSPKQLKLF